MTARKVDRAAAMREADFEGTSAPAEYRSAALAWDRLQNRITPSLAAELGLCRQTLEDMGNPGRRKRGPHLLIAQAMELALELKPGQHQRADVFAPLDWLEAKFGRLVVDAPESSAYKSPASQAKSIARLLVEFAQFIDAVDDPAEIDDASALAFTMLLLALTGGAKSEAPPARFPHEEEPLIGCPTCHAPMHLLGTNGRQGHARLYLWSCERDHGWSRQGENPADETYPWQACNATEMVGVFFG